MYVIRCVFVGVKVCSIREGDFYMFVMLYIMGLDVEINLMDGVFFIVIVLYLCGYRNRVRIIFWVRSIFFVRSWR